MIPCQFPDQLQLPLLLPAPPPESRRSGRDFQVLPEDDFAGFREQLAGRENTVFRLYPDLNHLFVPAIYDDILKASKDYSIERHIGEDVIGDIAGFIGSV